MLSTWSLNFMVKNVFSVLPPSMAQLFGLQIEILPEMVTNRSPKVDNLMLKLVIRRMNKYRGFLKIFLSITCRTVLLLTFSISSIRFYVRIYWCHILRPIVSDETKPLCLRAQIRIWVFVSWTAEKNKTKKQQQLFIAAIYLFCNSVSNRLDNDIQRVHESCTR